MWEFPAEEIVSYFFFPFTRFLRAAPALNLGLLEAAILISFPVWGLRPVLAALLATSKVPNPISWIFPPFLSSLDTTSVKALMVASVSADNHPYLYVIMFPGTGL